MDPNLCSVRVGLMKTTWKMILAIVFLKMDTMGPHIHTIYMVTHHPMLLELLPK